MVNRYRGEVEAVLDGRPHTLCLTLGALAELEDAFGEDDMLALAQRFEAGRLSARDAVRLIAAGLRGGGHDLTEADVARMQADGGAAGYVDIVVRLLQATFGMSGTVTKASAATQAGAATEAGTATGAGVATEAGASPGK